MQTNPQPRRSSRKRRKDKKLPMLIVCVLALALLAILLPKSPVNRALNVTGDGTGMQSMHAGLVISEVMTDNSSALPDEKGNFNDWVELWNTTENAMNLKDITLSDRPDRAMFIFPNYTLEPGARVIVYCDKTNQNDAGKPFHAKFGLSSIGESIYLFDTSGYILHSVTMPTLNANESYMLMEDGAFAKSEQYSPGFANTDEGHVQYMQNYVVETGDLIINEVMAAPRSGLRDEDDELSDWIELKNVGTKPIDLGDYALSDNEDKLLKWLLPEGAVIQPGGFYLVFCSGKNLPPDSRGIPHSNFSLGAEGETVSLSTRYGQLLDRVSYTTLPADQSYGRDPKTGEFAVFTVATPGEENDERGMAKADAYLRAINGTSVYISEVMSSNVSVQALAGADFCDWVELYNAGTDIVDMSLWGLSDNVSWPRKWRFPQGTSIWPGEYKIVLLDKSAATGTDAGSLHASFGLARAGGETVTLSDATGRVLDRLVLPEIPANISYGRTLGQDGFFYYDVATPGAVNGTGFYGYVTAPELSLQGGLYKEAITVSMAAQPFSEIRYTLDGAIPTLENSEVYSQPLTIQRTTVLRARAFTQGLQPSTVTTATYVMGTYHSMPVVTLVTDPDELWNEDTGMYATGRGINLLDYEKIVFKNPTPVYRLWGKIMRPGYSEMFLEDGTVMFSQGVEFGLIGQFSLDMPQKSFKVSAKAYLGEKYFNAALFEDRPFEQYRSFVLRMSGNDCVWTRMVDGVQSRLVDKLDTTVIHQAWNPVVVYLNGGYWGHYNMRERVSRWFVASHEGYDLELADDITILEGNSVVYYGSNAEYRAMLAKVKTLDVKNKPEDLQYMLDNIDVDNYFDYVILESFFANTDSGNVRYYKVPGGKWKWIMFDMDYGLFMASNNGIKDQLNPKGAGANDDIDNTLIRKLLENDVMLDRFLTRYGEIYRQLTAEAMLAQIDECYKLLEPEMQMHFERWAEYNLKSISSEQPQTVDGCLRYWNTRVNRLRNVVMRRPQYVYKQLQEWFSLSDAQMLQYIGPMPEFLPGADLDKNDKKYFGIE